MTKALAKADSTALVIFSDEERELIRKTFGPNLTKGEFDLFLYTSQAVGLNPLKRQIYAVKRKQWNPETRSYEERMTIQTGIDGFRAVSFRNGRTLPGKEPEFRYTTEKSVANPIGLISATAYLKVHGQDGQYHEVSATAYWDEYVPLTKEGKPQAMWGKMPRTMLAKCAEALLHRRCNPEQLSGIYTSEEMNQADAEKRVVEGVHFEAEPPAIPEQTSTYAEVPTTPTSAEVVEVDTEEVIKRDIETVKEVFPEAKVKKVQKKGKFGFLDEIKALKKQLGNDEEYYNILGVIGPGSYQHANEIDDRQEQIAFWKALKMAVEDKR